MNYSPEEVAAILPKLSPGAQLEVRALLAEQRLARIEADAVKSVEAEPLLSYPPGAREAK